MDLGIKGKKAIINGGSAGMGKGSALALAKEGVDLFISARGEKRLLETCEEIEKKTGVIVKSIVADHSSDEGREKILSSCPDPDILVGTCTPPPFTYSYEEVSTEEWRQTLDVSLLSPVEFMKAIIPGMVERKWGRIVNIASIAGKEGNPNASAYSTSKAGVIGLTKSLGKELAQKNIAVNCVTPAAAKTRIFDQMTEEHINYMLSKIPRNKFAKVEELASLVTWLASEENSFSTAAVFDLSGGRATY